MSGTATAEIEPLQREFEALGLRGPEARVLTALLTGGPGTASSLGQLARLPRPNVYAVVEGLEAQGLVVSVPGKVATWSARARDEILDRLVVMQRERHRNAEQRATEAREALSRLLPDASPTVLPFVHVIHRAAQYKETYQRLLREAEEEVLTCSRPPYSWPVGTPNAEVLQAIGRIRSSRGLVQASEFYSPEGDANRNDAEAYIRAGLELRVLPRLPLKVAIFDAAKVLVTMDNPSTDEGEYPVAVLVEHPGYGDWSKAAFEQLWSHAEPHAPEAGVPVDPT